MIFYLGFLGAYFIWKMKLVTEPRNYCN